MGKELKGLAYKEKIRLNKTTARLVHLSAEYFNTPFYRPAKRRALRSEIKTLLYG